MHDSEPELRQRQQLIARQIAILDAADGGQLDAHTCPQCEAAQVEIWFGKPTGGGCDIFAICTACGWSMQAFRDNEPPNFTPARLRCDIDQQPRQFPYP